MSKCMKWIMGIIVIFLSVTIQDISVFAVETGIPVKNTDCDIIKVARCDSYAEMGEKYLFTKESAGK